MTVVGALLLGTTAVLSRGATVAQAAPLGGLVLTPAGGLSFYGEIGGPPITQQANLTNTTSGTIEIFGATLVPAGPSPFSILDNCGPVLAASQTCSIDVTYAAAQAGASTAALEIESDSPTPGAIQTLDLTGQGTTGPPAPSAQASPQALRFSAQVATTSAPQDVTLLNAGTAPLFLGAVQLGGPNASSFELTGTGSCVDATAIASGASCTIGVGFSPATAGADAATLSIADNDPATAAQTVQLAGTANPAPAPLSSAPAASTPPPPQTAPPADKDGDGVPDAKDSCPTVAGNLPNGCPGELNADVRGFWRVNALLSQLLTLTVHAATGSRIEVRCTGRGDVCGFTKRVVRSTTTRATSLTSDFKDRRIFPAGVKITVLVTRPRETGTFEQLVTRTGRRLPEVLDRCLGAVTGAVERCP